MATETVKVMVRVRPMNSREKSQSCQDCTKVIEKQNSIVLFRVDDAKQEKQFTFDYVFGINSQQQDIYDQIAFPIVESVVEGYNGTMFAYGQTGCGKTFSMIGDPNSDIQKGIIPRAFNHIVNIISSSSSKNFLVRCSYLEIYNEEIHDLLGKDPKARLEMKEQLDKGVFIKDLSMIIVKSVDDMDKLMNYGNKNRAVGETLMNKDSSRSHSVFTVYIECQIKSDDSLTAGKLHMVDLAGSERQSKTQASGDRLKEGAKINLSLSALGNVISALVDGKTAHIPYRDSKLTRLLQDSLGGNTKTIMIAAISPADYNYEETMSTLRYASRAKMIKNQPRVNEDPKDALLREYAEEIKKLKELLQQSSLYTSKPNLETKPPLSKSIKIKSTEKNSDLNYDELQKLRLAHNELSKQKQQYQNQLKEQEEKINEEKQQRERLIQLIKEMEQKQIVGGQADDEEKKKFLKIQAQLKKQQKEKEKLMEEKQKKQNELINLESNYQNLQEEVEQLRDIIIRLRNKYKEALDEISDLQKEHEENREDLLDTIRFQEQENKLFKGILSMILYDDEIQKIKNSVQWNQEKNDYNIPPFYFKDKEVKFPKLPLQQAMDIVENEKQIRELTFGKKNSQKKNIRYEQEQLNNDWPNQPKFKESNLSYASQGDRKFQMNSKLEPLNQVSSSQNLQPLNSKTQEIIPIQKQYASDSEQNSFQENSLLSKKII